MIRKWLQAGSKMKKIILLVLFILITSFNARVIAAKPLNYCPTFDELQAKNSYFQSIRLRYGMAIGLSPTLEESSFYKSVVNACLAYFEDEPKDVDCSKLKTLSAAYAYRNFRNTTMKNKIKKTIENYSGQCKAESDAATMLLPRFR